MSTEALFVEEMNRSKYQIGLSCPQKVKISEWTILDGQIMFGVPLLRQLAFTGKKFVRRHILQSQFKLPNFSPIFSKNMGATVESFGVDILDGHRHEHIAGRSKSRKCE